MAKDNHISLAMVRVGTNGMIIMTTLIMVGVIRFMEFVIVDYLNHVTIILTRQRILVNVIQEM